MVRILPRSQDRQAFFTSNQDESMSTASFNTAMTLKSLAFISDSKLRRILVDILSEIDNVSLIGAARSTLYLSMSTLEGILTHLIIINKSNAEQYFPPKGRGGGQKKLHDLSFDDKILVANKLKFIKDEYYEIFKEMKKFRNFMHPIVELKANDQIDLGASQVSLGILNHTLNTLGGLRFIRNNVWKVISGEPTYELSSDVIEFKRGNTRTDSFIVTENFVGKEINVEFDLTLSGSGLLNFVYNYEQDSTFDMLRFDARNENDNGFLHCKHYAEWEYLEKFNYPLNKNIPNKISIRCSADKFNIAINNQKIELVKVNQCTKFDKNKRIGFFNELASLTVNKLRTTEA